MFTSWDDLGNPGTAGICISERFGIRVELAAKDIASLKANPEARFRLVQYKTLGDADTWNLGNIVD